MIRLGELATVIDADMDALNTDARGMKVHDVEHDSRSVARGTVFACIPGSCVNGHEYADQAVQAGAVALLAEQSIPEWQNAPVLKVESVRRALGPAAAAVHGNPSEQLDLIGVTGTDGKTSTVRLIASLLKADGRCVYEIGTLTGPLTTPEATTLQRELATAAAEGVHAVAMEVSSHALAQHRVNGCRFRVAVFTNFGRDHLDYHGSVGEYFRAKERLFKTGMSEQAVINVDTPEGEYLAAVTASSMPVVKVSKDSIEEVDTGLRSSRFRWRSQQVHLPLGGEFHIANAVTAAETAVLLGMEPRIVAEVLGGDLEIPGRFESVEAGQDFTVIVDYAHTPKGLQAVLEASRGVADGRVAVVFGAGGDRDRGKRSAMGRIAEEQTDLVVVTTDNPRSEEPLSIIFDVVDGMHDKPVCVEPRLRSAIYSAFDRADASTGPVVIVADRRLAIRRAFEWANPGDVVVIAGKGHESVQIVRDEALEFDDRQVAREELSRLIAHRAEGNRSAPGRDFGPMGVSAPMGGSDDAKGYSPPGDEVEGGRR